MNRCILNTRKLTTVIHMRKKETHMCEVYIFMHDFVLLLFSCFFVTHWFKPKVHLMGKNSYKRNKIALLFTKKKHERHNYLDLDGSLKNVFFVEQVSLHYKQI